MASVFLTCEQMIYMGGSIGWSTCGETNAKVVTFPRTPPMVLCAEHEREATRNKATGLPAHSSGDPGGSK